MLLLAAIATCVLAVPQRPVVGSLVVGDSAPNFKLRLLQGEGSFELKSNFGKQPTVLVFGSYT
jgi:hypothetical protein